MKVLVTGGLGYIGGALLEQLDKYNAHVDVVDNTMYHQGSSYFYRALGANSRHVTFHHLDMAIGGHINRVKDLAKDADTIIFLHALVGMGACLNKPESFVRFVNAKSIELILQDVSKHQRILYMNSNSAYGTNPEVCTETSPLNPISLYAETKQLGEEIVMRHPGATVLRLATVFGVAPRMRLDLLVNYLVYEAFFNGKIDVYEGNARRNFVHVRDVARIIGDIIGDERTFGQVYNFGNDEINMDKNTLIRHIQEAVPSLKITQSGKADPDRRDYLVSSAKINTLRHVAKIGISEGIRELLEFYKLLPFGTAEREQVTQHMRNA